MNIAQFAAIIQTAVAEAEHHARERLEKAARIVEAEAKAIIGEYQAASGPFAAWPPLADRTLQTNVNNTPGLVSGDMRDSISKHVNGDHSAEIGSSDKKLTWFEIGTKNQPPRSVLGIAAVHKEKEVVEVLGHGAVRTLTGNGTETEF